MARPRKIKLVHFEPDVTYFKPRAVPLNQLEEVELTFDELESLRLSSIEKSSQSDAALKMGIHQSTFQRTVTRAKEKIADALINGKAIKICGGEYKMPNRDRTGPIGGRGQGRRFNNIESDGLCKCPKCGYEQPHVRGQPCNQTKCPKCSVLMTRT